MSHAIHEFPALYKKSNTGAILKWQIFVEDNVIKTKYGQDGGLPQLTEDVVKVGKNIGKKNETTACQQAFVEASAKWRKKQEREGYVEDYDRACRGMTDADGGIPPMLAQPFKDAKKHVTFPCDAQRKYNGVRCLVMVERGTATLWSRKRTRILGVPHIEEAYTRYFAGKPHGPVVLDGEIYKHGWSLQTISGFARKQEAKEDFQELSHIVYDIPSVNENWARRRDFLGQLFHEGLRLAGPTLQLAPTISVQSLAAANALHDQYVEDGYEGVILRDPEAPYEAGKRSYGLVKLKAFKDGEFEIVDTCEGRGRMAGRAIFICRTFDNKRFECVAPGSMENKAELFRKRDELVGKMLTVKYFETTDGGKPSHGVGVSVRDYE